jgi:hypothetical protein
MLKTILILACAGIAAVVIVGLAVLAVYTVFHDLGIAGLLVIGGIIIALCGGGGGRGSFGGRRDGWFSDAE